MHSCKLINSIKIKKYSFIFYLLHDFDQLIIKCESTASILLIELGLSFTELLISNLG